MLVSWIGTEWHIVLRMMSCAMKRRWQPTVADNVGRVSSLFAQEATLFRENFLVARA